MSILGSPIKYSSRTFQTILNDINSVNDLADKPDWFKKIVAGVGDMLSMINNGASNNAYLRTAFTRQAVIDLCQLIGYELPPATTSIGTIIFYFPETVTFPFTVDTTDLAAATRGTVAISARRFESRTADTFTAITETVDLGANPIALNKLIVARAFLTGEKVRLTTSGTIPSGLSLSKDYYAIYIDATHIYLADTVAKAFAGTALTISGGTGNLTLSLYSGRSICYQQEAKAQQTIGTSDGITEWQEYALPDKEVLRDTLSISINGTVWTRVDALALSQSYDAHYQHIYNLDGSSFIRFGNGVYGAIPANFDILAQYAIGGGVDANITNLNMIAVYAGGNANISGCANATSFTGGSDEQAIETAKNTAPGTLKSRDRFITEADGETLALGYGGLSIVKVIPNAFGVLSAKVVGIAIGGGNPNSSLKAALDTYLTDRTVLESIDVRVLDATITAENVISAAKMLPGYTWSSVQPLFRLGWKLFFAETGQEIIDVFLSSGIGSAVTRINTLYSESFTSADYSKIQKLIEALYSIGPRSFGETIQESDAITFLQGYVTGIDYMTVTAPTFPLAMAVDQITTYGTLTLSEIV